MFPSAGYFKSINCPFFDNGLCERPFCQFRHVRREESATNLLSSAAGALSIGGVGTSIEQLVSEAVKRVISENNQLINQLDVSRFQQVLQSTVTNSASALVERLTPAVGQKKYSIPADVPSYKPTPIKLLEQAKASGTPAGESAYSPTVSNKSNKYKASYSEYEPKLVSAPWSKKAEEESEPKFSSDEDDEESIDKKQAQTKTEGYAPGSLSTPANTEYDPAETGTSGQGSYQPGEVKKSTESYVPAYSDSLTFNLDYKPSKRTDKDLDYKPSKKSEKSERSSVPPSKYEPLAKQTPVAKEEEYVPSAVKAEQEYVPSSQKGGVGVGITSPERILEQLESDSEVSSTTTDTQKQSKVETVTPVVTKDKAQEDEKKRAKDREESRKIRSKEKHKKRDRTPSKERKHESKKAKKKDRSRSRSKERKSSKDRSKKTSSKDKKKHERSRSREKTDRKRSRSRDRKKHDSKSEKSDKKDYKRDKDRTSSKDKKKEYEKREEKHSGKRERKESESRERSRHESKEKARKESTREEYEKPQKKERKESTSERSAEQKKTEKKEIEKEERERKTSEASVEEDLEPQSGFEGPPAGEDDYFPDLSMLEELDDIFEDLGEEDLNNEELMEECYKIFQDYKPEAAASAESQKKAKLQEAQPNVMEPASVGKKRMAHFSQTPVAQREQPAPKIAKMSPAVMMQERLRLMKELYMLRKQAAQARMDVQESSTVSSTSGPSTSTGVGGSQANKKRIAHVPNVQSLLKKPGQPAPVVSKPVVTRVGQTNEKGSARTAHVPAEVMLERPMVAPDSSNKVPVSVRQRYLNIIIDHLLNTGIPEKDAYDQAVDEEKSAYNRSGTKPVYLNAVVSAINRLKKAAESAKAGGVSAGNQKVSHLQVLAGKPGAKGSWSIEKAKKNPDILTGPLLYKLLEKYIMKFEELESNGFPIPDPAEKGRAKMVINTFRKKADLPPLSDPYERRCDRCPTIFLVDRKGVPVRKEECIYHWGKPMKRRGIGGLETKYSCCGCDVDSAGCTVGASHVIEPTDLNSVRGFVSTLPKSPPEDGDWGIYALDCEMCYTTCGVELTRVTVIGTDCQTVYETLVKPDSPILDYNTRFSGITEEDLIGVKTSIRDVQAVLLSRFSDRTILIGHSLESDFKALKLIHQTVIDTSVVFPHKMGPPYKKALRTLSADILKKIIQNDVSGHDSAEDAITCMELMIWKVKEDLKMLR